MIGLLLLIGTALIYLASIPATTRVLRAHLEIFPPLDLKHLEAEAIVVLGADRYPNAPEYGGDTLGELGLERARYAAWLHKKTGLPILASGGCPAGEAVPEAVIIRHVLQQDFQAEVRWIEDQSQTTFENAINSSALLAKAGIQRIALVTHAWHMPRALEAFRQTGLQVIPASTVYYQPSPPHTGFMALLPSTSALHRNRLCLHEIIGRWWYHLRYYSCGFQPK